MKVLSLFDGISCGLQALKGLNIPIEKYYASEIDKYAIEVSKKNHPEIIQLGDIENWKEWDIEWDEIDMVIGGSPCTNLSFAGDRTNLAGKYSSLFFVYHSILEHLRKINPNILFLLENVKMDKESYRTITRLMRVEGVRINSNIFSAQNRDRIYWTNIPIMELPKPTECVLQNILREEDNHNPRLPISKKHHEAWLKSYKWKADEINSKSKPLLASYYKQPPHCPYIKYRDIQANEEELKESIYRRLSPIECERLQTLPDNYTLVINEKGKENSYMQRYKMLGNGWTVAAIRHIFSSLEEEIFIPQDECSTSFMRS